VLRPRRLPELRDDHPLCSQDGAETPYLLDSYWSPEEEAKIVFRLCRLLMHPNLDLEGQNFHLRRPIHPPRMGDYSLC